MCEERKDRLSDERRQALQEFATKRMPQVSRTQLTELIPLLDRATTTQAWADLYGGRSNEGLEFSGDAILFLAALEGAMELHFRERRVHVLERMTTILTSGRVQIQLAHEIGVDKLLLVPASYRMKERHFKFECRGVLDGNALEAIIGAVAVLSVKLAIQVAKGLMQATLREVAMQMYAHPVMKQASPFGTRDELFGHARLKVYITQELLRQGRTTRVYGLHRAREAMLKPARLALYAREVQIDEGSEEKSVRLLLTASAQEKKLSRTIKAAVQDWTRRSIADIQAEQGYLISRDGIPVRKPSSPKSGQAEGELVTLLNGHAKCRFETRPFGGGEERGVIVICSVNNQPLGQARHKDVKVAREQAAQEALNHPALEKVRTKHT